MNDQNKPLRHGKAAFIEQTASLPFLKAQLHIHTREDPFDGKHISYSAEDLILLAREYNYHIIAVTNHNVAFTRDQTLMLRDNGNKNGIVFVPGVEMRIKNRDILLYFDYGSDPAKITRSLHTMADVRACKNDGLIRLVIIPHPFFHFHSIDRKALDYLDIIDAVEFNWFYTHINCLQKGSFLNRILFNMNNEGEAFARQHHLPLLASGDLHSLDWFDKDFSLLRCRHDLESFFNVFAQSRRCNLSSNELKNIFDLRTTPLGFRAFRKEATKIMRHVILHYALHPWHLLPK